MIGFALWAVPAFALGLWLGWSGSHHQHRYEQAEQAAILNEIGRRR